MFQISEIYRIRGDTVEEVCIPIKRSSIRSNSSGVNYLTELFSKVREYYNCKIKFDFQDLEWIDANLITFLGALIEVQVYENSCEVVLLNMNKSLEIVLQKNGFLLHYTKKERVKDSYNSTIQYKVFNSKAVDDFTHYLNDSLLKKIQSAIPNPGVKKALKTSLCEVFVNIEMHALSNKVYTCGQFFPKKKKVAFTILDLGRTIGDNYRECHEEDSDANDSEAINWATVKGNTTKKTGNGGLGLYVIQNFLIANKGHMIIKSGYGTWEVNNGVVKYKDNRVFFPGAAISIVTQVKASFLIEK